MKDASHLSKIIPISTVDKIYGYEIDDHVGVIIMSASTSGGIIADFKSSWADFLGLRSKTYERKFDEYINDGLESMRKKVLEMGANGIIGFRCESESIQSGKSMV
ncbi:MAG: heavy metal-binding domain-containing protein, partial [Syntrophorhabdus sp.]